jgi:hypothetical protein
VTGPRQFSLTWNCRTTDLSAEENKYANYFDDGQEIKLEITFPSGMKARSKGLFWFSLQSTNSCLRFTDPDVRRITVAYRLLNGFMGIIASQVIQFARLYD